MSKRGSVDVYPELCHHNVLGAADRFCSRGGASGNKLKMTLGLPVYVESHLPFSECTIHRALVVTTADISLLQWGSHELL